MIAVSDKPRENTEIHTGLLRLGLAVDDSREYWRRASDGSNAPLTEMAFEQRWFGPKSAARVAYLIGTFGLRFKAFPPALANLKAWDPVDLQDRRWVCHWHLQLADPLYRRFTQDYLTGRMQHPEPSVTKRSALEWLDKTAPGNRSVVTSERLVSGLVSSVSEAGFCSGTQSTRPLSVPHVSNAALAYLLYTLNGLDFEGSLFKNPYLESAQLLGEGLLFRVQKLPGFTYRKSANVSQLDWPAPTFIEWLKHCE